jgi:hypothetical protein
MWNVMRSKVPARASPQAEHRSRPDVRHRHVGRPTICVEHRLVLARLAGSGYRPAATRFEMMPSRPSAQAWRNILAVFAIQVLAEAQRLRASLLCRRVERLR